MAFLKEIQNGQGVFNKEIIQLGENTISDSNLKFTYASRTDLTNRPFGNLFVSFNFPVTQNDISNFNTNNLSNLLYHLNVDNVIVVEIPQNEYGELIDGKTIEFNLPIDEGLGNEVISCYGTYINAGAGVDYDSKVSESYLMPHYFNVTPNTANGNNSNMVLLFSDYVKQPELTKTTVETEIYASAYTTTASFYNELTETVSQTVSVDTSYRVSLSSIVISATSTTDLATVASKFNDTYFDIMVNGSKVATKKLADVNPTLITNQTTITVSDMDLDFEDLLTSASTLSIRFRTNATQVSPITINLSYSYSYNSLNFTYTKTWDKWTRYNKFSSATGKVLADYYNDVPVGIAYLDKGFIVLTHPDIVDNFNYSASTSSGFNSITSGVTYSGTSNEFTQVYFTGSTNASLTFKSFKTEFIQSIDCFALPNEFYQSQNPTYSEAYGTETVEPVYITEVGLYNANQELIGIAKTSKPLSKTKDSILTFNVNLKL